MMPMQCESCFGGPRARTLEPASLEPGLQFPERYDGSLQPRFQPSSWRGRTLEPRVPASTRPRPSNLAPWNLGSRPQTPEFTLEPKVQAAPVPVVTVRHEGDEVLNTLGMIAVKVTLICCE
jgi:hypothetical protein